MTRIYFKENLARLRKNNKLSLEQMGKIVGKTYNAIYRWEKGETEPTLMDVAILSEYFDIPVDVLLFTDISLDYPPTISQRILDDYKTLDKSDQEVHSSVKETLDTYSHFFPSETDIITDKMDEILKKST